MASVLPEVRDHCITEFKGMFHCGLITLHMHTAGSRRYTTQFRGSAIINFFFMEAHFSVVLLSFAKQCGGTHFRPVMWKQ